MKPNPGLYPYQIAGARFLSERRFAVLADDPGLAKRPQALAALRELDSSALVVAPTADLNAWHADVARVSGLSLDVTRAGIFPMPYTTRGRVRVMTPEDLLRRRLPKNAAPRRGSVLILSEVLVAYLGRQDRLRVKIARLADAFVRSDGGVWLMVDPSTQTIEGLYDAMCAVGFMLRRRRLPTEKVAKVPRTKHAKRVRRVP